MAKREKTSINHKAASSQKQNSPYILIVEDEPTHAVIIRHAIQSADPNAVVKVVESLKEYRSAISNSLPEIVLIDYYLPDGNLFDVMTLPPEDGLFPFVVMTNSGDEKLAVKAIKGGALDYIAKTSESFQLVPHTIEHALREWKILMERKRAERELRESELRYKMFSELVTDYVYKIGVSSDGKVSLDFVSDGFYSITGRSREEVITVESWRKIFHPDDLGKAMEFLQRLIIDHQSGEIECRSYVHGHTLRWINIVAKSEWDEQEKRVTAIIGAVKDITARKQVEEALRQNEEKFRNVFESANIGKSITLPSGEINVNQAFCDMLGYTREELRNKKWQDITPPDEVGKAQEIIDSILIGKKDSARFHKRYIHKNGSYVWADVSVVLQRDINSKPLYFITTVIDITERKQRENELQREQNFIKSITETSPIGITRLDRNGKILFANLRAEQILGLSKNELSGQSYNAPAFNITDVHGNIYPDELLPFNLVKNNLKPVADIQHAISWPDGQRVLLSINAAPLYNDLGQFDGMVSSVEDITEKKKVEEALRQSESSLKRQNELLSALLENLKIGVFMVEVPTGKPLIANKMAMKLLGRGILSDANKNNLSEVYSACKQGSSEPYPAEEMPIIRSMYGESSHIDDMVVKRPDSTEVILEVFGSSIKDENGQTWAGLVSFQDITERKQMEDQLRQMQKLEGLGTLAGGIAHDFNNILGIILAYISSIKLNRGDNSKIDLAVNTIMKTVERGKTLVQQILTFARKTKIEFGSMNVNDVVKEIMSMIYETFPKILTYTQNIDNDIPCIRADHSQLHQALLNLCVNARDAMPGGGVLTINTSMVSGMDLHSQHPDADASRYVCIEVSDTGEGMSKEIRQRIFDPFFTTKEQGKGTGMGLAVVFGVVQTHKGFIDVESEIGKGTTFRLYLPALHVAESISVKEEDWKDIPGGTETLLVVEDEEMLIMSLRTALIEKGYKVISAEDGLKALNIYQERKNDIALVLTDLGLPNMNGMEVCRGIKKINPNEHVILATGFLDPDMKQEFLDAGIQNFLYKPYDLREVLKVVREVLDKK